MSGQQAETVQMVTGERVALAQALGCEFHGPDYGECASCSAEAERVWDEGLDAIIAARLAARDEQWIQRLAGLCDDDWLRQRDRAMDLPGCRTHNWVRRGSSAWEHAAHQVRSILNDLANYEDEWVDTHAAYRKWMREGRDTPSESSSSPGTGSDS